MFIEIFPYSCFLSHIGAFWGAFLAPILVVILFNVVIFTCVVVVLIRHTRRTASGNMEALNKKSIILIVIRVGGVMFLFGLTWLFAILTFSVPGLRETFQILFTVLNSFQGFFIFLFLCVFNKDAQESWKGTYVGRKLSSLFQSQSSNYSSGNITSKRNATPKDNLSSGTNRVTLEKSNPSENSYESSTGYKANTLVIANKLSSEKDLELSDKALPNEGMVKEFTTTESAIDQTVSVNIEKDISKEKEFSKSNNPELKIKIRRFSTKREGKHHVEEMEVELYSDSDAEGI